ncbi:MAG: hypothetical protein ACRENX_07810 [Candidatus Dormibacteria bacterium]
MLTAGAAVVSRGLPANLGGGGVKLEVCPVIAVSSFGMFFRRTVLDLLLARRFWGAQLDATFLRGLVHGGLLSRELIYHYPASGAATDMEETA